MYAIYLTSPNKKKRPVDGDPGFNHFLQLFHVAFTRKLLQSKLSIFHKHSVLLMKVCEFVKNPFQSCYMHKFSAKPGKKSSWAIQNWSICLSSKVWCLKWVLCVFSFLDPWGMLFVLIANKVAIKDQACYWKIF